MSARPSHDPARLRPDAFARDGAVLSGTCGIERFPRLAEDHPPGAGPLAGDFSWHAVGMQRPAPGSAPETWLHVTAGGAVWRICQRCLQPMPVALKADRRFRFVRGETAAAELDADAEDDVLALPARLDLFELIEDELLLALPIVTSHDPAQCAGAAALHLQPAAGEGAAGPQGDAAGDDAAPAGDARPDEPADGVGATVRPFAGLAGLVRRGRSG